MKRLLPLLALLCLASARADEAADLDALCVAAGGQIKRTDISNVRRTGGWRVTLDAASAELAKLCGDLPPNIQLQDGKLNASCGSGK